MEQKKQQRSAEGISPENRVTRELVTRRSFLRNGAAAIGGVATVSAAGDDRSSAPSSYLDLLRAPDLVTVYQTFVQKVPGGKIALQRTGEQWRGGPVLVETVLKQDALVLALAAPSTPVVAVHVRWSVPVTPGLRALGDAWERSYGELGWRALIPERAMPWYFATHDGVACHGYGVRTDAAALCFWQLDPEGASLWLNVANGGDGVELGQRHLTLASVVTRRGVEGESSHDAVAGLCRKLCARATRPIAHIYGANDWNYAYGKSTAETILQDTEFIVELSPSGGVRPFSVIDDGWRKGPPAWPDMGQLAADIRRTTARPGIWIRPLEAPPGTAGGLLLPDARFGEKTARAHELAYDPTVPESQQKIRAKMRQAIGWGYELVKHDFTTYDLLGQWGFEMDALPTLPGWSLHDRSRTNAEVIAALYALLREAAGEQTVLDGCNTISLLGQGIFDLQRSGDDTSGRLWERTRRMGVNTLAFRLPQHGAFSTLDADMVGITEAIPWELNRQWLDAVARSGTVTFIAAGPPARGQEQRAAIREAFRIAAAGGAAARPVDWMDSSTPERWQATGKASTELRYRWSGPEGASAFSV